MINYSQTIPNQTQVAALAINFSSSSNSKKNNLRFYTQSVPPMYYRGPLGVFQGKQSVLWSDVVHCLLCKPTTTTMLDLHGVAPFCGKLSLTRFGVQILAEIWPKTVVKMLTWKLTPNSFVFRKSWIIKVQLPGFVNTC